MGKANYLINTMLVEDLFKITDGKYPGLVNKQDREQIIKNLLQIVEQQDGEVCYQKTIVIGNHTSERIFVFKLNGYKEIEFNLYGINANTSKRRIIERRLFVIKPKIEVMDDVVKSTSQLLGREGLTSGIYARLVNNYTSLNRSLRNKIVNFHYTENNTSLILELINDIKVTLPVKGVTLIGVVITKPEYVEFKITQKCLPQLHIVLQGHL